MNSASSGDDGFLTAYSNLVRKKSKNMTAILGISAFYHDSAAALVVDGEVRAAVQEER
ncbi:MAG: carbamoyltransferase N-terminal domain-containing protein, partial [Planctomycetota bacterium]|nr:carbamoyltransferase N-terminal domain-containing protein [Planctomycetota bacterium]